MKYRNISSNDDVIDSRDVIERLRELEDERQALADEVDEARAADDAANDNAPDADFDLAKTLDAKKQALENWDEENAEELTALRKLAEEGEGIDDWGHGVALIRESYFVDYCREFVQDIGDLPRNIPHYLEIDWEKTADNLRIDYTEIDFDGVTYLAR